MLKLLGRKTSGNVQKVVWLLEELGEAYEREDYGRQFGNTADDAYLALNPNGKVPTLLDGGLAIWESNSILRYLARKSRSPLYPSGFAERSQVERWMDWQLASLNNSYMAIFRESKQAPEERSPALADHGKDLDQQLTLLEGAIGDWVAGSEMSLADICLGPIVARCLSFPVELSALPKVRAWHERVAARETFQTATG